MNYESSQPFRGNPAGAINFAAATLAASGFRIQERTDTTLRVSGGMFNSNKNPLFGSSQITLSVSGGRVQASAKIDGPKRVMLLVAVILFFTFGLIVVTFLLASMHDQHGHTAGTHQKLILGLLPLCPWPVVIPLMYFLVRYKARKAVDTLVHNAATMAGS
jgi:hypothetical protein